MKIENAKIESTFLGVEDHGIFTASVGLSGDGWVCGFGGFALDRWSEKDKKRIASAAAGLFIARVIEVLEAGSWEKLKGLHCRAKTEGLGGGILEIGHIVKDRWFNPKDELAKLAPRDR